MDQLLNMGFSQQLSVQALAATGGKSTLKATEWILNQKPASSSPLQPKLDQYFQSKHPSQTQFLDVPITVDPVIEENHTNPEYSDPPAPKRLKPWPQSLLGSPPPPKPHHNSEPLSERMRPQSVEDVVGQDHLLGKNSVLRSALDCDLLPSIVFWGPPGTGKTTIAKAIANSAPASYRFVSLSAVTAGVKDVREAVEEAKKLKKKNKTTVLFVDEVHRFNKSQQDSFLPVIEDGSIVFMGATTENPSFHLITPLLSRCRVLTLNRLQSHHVVKLLERAVTDLDKGLARSVRVGVLVEDEAVEFLSLHCEGDARVALNGLEIAAIRASARRMDKQFNKEDASSSSPFKMFRGGREAVAYSPSFKTGGSSGDDNNCAHNENNGLGSFAALVTLDDAKEALQCKHLVYDRAGEEHYNLISALHKSMRGSDADASIYWLARMLEGGEQPLYIARRLIRFASEDVGLADPSAITQAVACYQASHFLGMPECNVNLAQCVAYLALAPKSVAVYRAIEAAEKVVRESVGGNEGVPLHLRNAPTKLMKEIGYGKGYIYPPDHPSSALQSYMPPSLQGHKFLNWPPLELIDEKRFSPSSSQQH